ncbi:DsrE family protein [Erythrobacter sp. Alg231-14]|uniref:DsrE family protein n=1 Tax=Erythrobacter sp. Alg231-14 TaxID=1922225 RepID=UPI000D54F677
MTRITVFSLSVFALASPLAAQSPNLDAFSTGPVFEEFGPHAPVEGGNELPSLTRFSIAFDVAKKADPGTRNRGFESAARFINMHVAAGVPADRINIAIVVHGGATRDLVAGDENSSQTMVRALLDYGVRFIVCGQSAAANGVSADELIEGVEMDLSAMTAHALLQQDGYTVNPF